MDVHSSVAEINGGLMSADLMEDSPLITLKETTVISLDYVRSYYCIPMISCRKIIEPTFQGTCSIVSPAKKGKENKMF